MAEIKYRKLSELKKLKGNPRIIQTEELNTLVKSLKENPEYFEARPIILSDRTGELIIIAGNQRYEAAKLANLKQIPTFLIQNLTEKKEKEIIIRDNVSNGNWDIEQLESWDKELLTEWGLDLDFSERAERGTTVEFKKPTTIKLKYSNEKTYSQVKTKLEAIDPDMGKAVLKLLKK